MLHYLPEVVQSFSSQSRRTVSSLIQSVKADKAQISALVQNLRSLDLPANYAPTLALRYSMMEVEGVVEFFRDSSLRIGEFFSASASIGNVLNSMVYIYESEIQKIEKDIEHLENFIDNYQFLVGEDDLFNFNYVENFDNNLNSDNSTIKLFDRDEEHFSENGNYSVDSTLSKMIISSGINFSNQINNIKDLVIHTNYSYQTTTDTDFLSTINESISDNWTVTVKSPIVLTSKLNEYKKYLPYDSSYIDGAQTMVQLDFINPVEMDTIRLRPNYSNGLQLLQVVIQKTEPTLSIYTASSQNEYVEFPILNSPLSLQKQVDVVFDKSKVSSIKFIFNQSKYTRNSNSPIRQELISKSLSELVSKKRSERKRKASRLQDIVYFYFRNKIDISEIRKNRKTYTEYYSYRYPSIYEKNTESVIEKFKDKSLYEAASRLGEEINSGSRNELSNMVQSIVLHVIGNRNNLFNTKVYRSRSYEDSDGRIYNLNSDGFVPMKNEQNNFDKYFQKEDAMAPGVSLDDVLKYTSNKEPVNNYEYSFSLNSILFGLSNPTQQTKACFVSKKIEANGAVVAVKGLVNIINERKDLTINNYDLREPGSYELSVCYKDDIQSEYDWVPLDVSIDGKINSEVLFFNEIETAYLRFNASPSSVRIYKNGILENPNLWEISNSYSEIKYKVPVQKNAIYVAEYDLNKDFYTQNIIELDRLNDSSYSIRSFTSGGNPGERFSGTGPGNKISLSYIPFIENKFSSAYYSDRYGTINVTENVGYSPITVTLSNGDVAVNLTNYTNNNFLKATFYDTPGYLYFQNGKELIFNKPINEAFTVSYSYIPSNLRFRLIIRNNIPGQINGISVNNVIIKCKVNNLDPFSNKLLRLS